MGGLVHWLSERRRAQYRTAYAQAHAQAYGQGRWGPDSNQYPPEGDSNALPLSEVFKSYPRMIESPTAGHRVDLTNIGMAVSERPSDGVPGPSNYQSFPSSGNLGTSGGERYQPYSDYQPHHQNIGDHKRPNFQEDDCLAQSTSQDQPLSPRGPSAVSALRPRAAPRSNPFRKRSPPPIDIPLNHSGAPPTRIRPPPRRERQNSVRAASNAHAPLPTNVTITSQHRRKITPEDVMKPLPAPASPELFAPELRPPIASYSIACKSENVLTQMTLNPPSPTISATPSSNLEGRTNYPKKLGDIVVPITFNRRPSASTATSFSMTNSIASHSTTFESFHSYDVTPEEITSCTTPRASIFNPSTASATPKAHHSIHYPRVPRSANEHVPRAFRIDNDTLSPLATKTAPLSSTNNHSPPRTPLSASSAIYTPLKTSRQRIQPKRINTSPANSGLTLASTTAANVLFSPVQYQQTTQHHRNLSSTTITPQTHQRGKSSGETTATASSGRSVEMRSTPATPWSAGCGVIEVALRSPSWSFGSGSPGLGVC